MARNRGTRRGRGRLSSIDMLPAEARDDVLWACQELYARKRSIAEIFEEFNARLLVKGLEPIKRTAFYDNSFRLAAAQERMRQSREMFAGLATQFTAKDVDENTVILGEYLKTLIQELVDNSSGLKSPKEAMELSRAFQATVAAQKVSSDRRLKLEREYAQKTEEAVREVGKAKGWSEGTVQETLAGILGVEVKRP